MVIKIGEGLEKYLETASRLVSRAAARRFEDSKVHEQVRRVDSVLVGSRGKG